MVRTQSWSSEVGLLVLQYLAVVFSSIPAGVLYVLTMKITGAHYFALIASLSVGVLLAHLAWHGVKERGSLDINDFVQDQRAQRFEVAISLAWIKMAVSLTSRPHVQSAVRPLSDDPKDIGLYVVTSHDKFFEALPQ